MNESNANPPNVEIVLQEMFRVVNKCGPWIKCYGSLHPRLDKFSVQIILEENSLTDAYLFISRDSGAINSTYAQIPQDLECSLFPVSRLITLSYTSNKLKFVFEDHQGMILIFENTSVEQKNHNFEVFVSQFRICASVSKNSIENENLRQHNDNFLLKYNIPENEIQNNLYFDAFSIPTCVFPIIYDHDGAGETWVKRNRALNASFFTEPVEITVCCYTWNVGEGGSPSQDPTVMKDFDELAKGNYDIYFFAFQEIDMSIQAVVSGNSPMTEEWTRCIKMAFSLDHKSESSNKLPPKPKAKERSKTTGDPRQETNSNPGFESPKIMTTTKLNPFNTMNQIPKQNQAENEQNAFKSTPVNTNQNPFNSIPQNANQNPFNSMSQNNNQNPFNTMNQNSNPNLSAKTNDLISFDDLMPPSTTQSNAANDLIDLSFDNQQIKQPSNPEDFDLDLLIGKPQQPSQQQNMNLNYNDNSNLLIFPHSSSHNSNQNFNYNQTQNYSQNSNFNQNFNYNQNQYQNFNQNSNPNFGQQQSLNQNFPQNPNFSQNSNPNLYQNQYQNFNQQNFAQSTNMYMNQNPNQNFSQNSNPGFPQNQNANFMPQNQYQNFNQQNLNQNFSQQNSTQNFSQNQNYSQQNSTQNSNSGFPQNQNSNFIQQNLNQNYNQNQNYSQQNSTQNSNSGFPQNQNSNITQQNLNQNQNYNQQNLTPNPVSNSKADSSSSSNQPHSSHPPPKPKPKQKPSHSESHRYRIFWPTSLGGVYTCFLVRDDFPLPIQVDSPKKVRLGLHGMTANKSAIVYPTKIGEFSRINFIGCHLTAHQGNLESRLNEMRDLLRTNLTVRSTATSTLSSSSININNSSSSGGGNSIYEKFHSGIEKVDHIVLIGDLNYRINMNYEQCLECINNNDLEALVSKDQLNEAKKVDTEIALFEEGPISFLPSYKFDKKSDVYDTSPKQRVPSYTDRILVVTNKNKKDDEEENVSSYSKSGNKEGQNEGQIEDKFIFETDIIHDLFPNARGLQSMKHFSSDLIPNEFPSKPKFAFYFRGTNQFSDHRPVQGILVFKVPKSIPEKLKKFEECQLKKMDEMSALAMPQIEPKSTQVKISMNKKVLFKFKNVSVAWMRWRAFVEKKSDDDVVNEISIHPSNGVLFPDQLGEIEIRGLKKTKNYTRNLIIESIDNIPLAFVEVSVA